MSGSKKVVLLICVFIALLSLFSLACDDSDIASVKAEPGELKKDVDTQVKEFKDLITSFDYPHTE